MTQQDTQQQNQRRAVIRTAIALALFALGCYAAFVITRL
jgi:hypothetical protein